VPQTPFDRRSDPEPPSAGLEERMSCRTAFYEFGGYRLDPAARVLSLRDRPIALPPKSFDLLLLLVGRRGRVLERDELMRELWPDTIVEEANLTFQVSTLRKALGEDGSRWIETVPKHGYRFTAPVREVRPEDTRDRDALSMPPPVDRVRLGPPKWPRAAAGVALVAVIAAFVVFWYAPRPDVPILSEIRLEAVPLTSYTGFEAEPTFSPDGSHVAFTWDGENQDNHDIYVKAIGAEQPLKLTSDRARDGSPAWSPDGTRIAFLRDKPRGGSEVRLIPPTGGEEHTIGEVLGQAHQGLSWSPDGRSLAVVDRSSPGERPGVFVLDVVGGVKKRLTPPTNFDIQPAFSPDGRTLAFTRQLFSPAFGAFVHVVPVEGGEAKVVVPTSVRRRGRLAWIAGGKEILFAAVPLAEDGGQPRPSSYGRVSTYLWRVPVDGGQARPLAGSERAGDVAVSRDGHRLVYSQGTLDWDIWRLDLRPVPTTGEAQTRFAPSTEDDWNPQFSPDGERVAFTSVRSGQAEIWVVDGQGRHPRQLTSLGRTGGSVGAPRWSPDGKMIAFDFTAKGGINVDIYVISASGGTPKQVTTSPAIDSLASWSRNGRFIYFGSHRDGQVQVWQVPSSGEEPGNARQVTRAGGFAAIEATDGHVYFTKRMSGTLNPQNALWRIPVEGGDEEVVVEGFRSSHGNWDLTDKGLYFVDEEPSSSGTSWVVRFQEFDRRDATEVARLRHPPFLGGPAISVSSDGRWMLSTQSQGESDLMLVENFR
jgi:Tol biopolymer transport system component/DNA-binding winged helix-turn-helix (wHTH) protein